ncbi:MAG: HAD family hydrolase [Clostridia bacterium]|nr:HAD family hydrolase [Clostridia bacterium]
MIKTVIYDLDGTLLDTLSTITYYGNKAMEHFGLNGFESDRYKLFVGNGARVLIKRLIEANNADANEYFERAFEYYNEIYNAAPLYLTSPYDGITELVEKLGEMGIKQAVLSNKPDFAVKSNVSHFFGDSFDKVYGARDGVPLKPDPAMLKALLDELGIKPDECVYVGDTDVDMKTGRAAGAYTVGVLWGFRDRAELEANGADAIVSTPNEILDVIMKRN